MRAAGARWVLHVDVDEFAAPAEGSWPALLARLGASAPAYAMPSVFYAPCPGDAAGEGLEAATCAGRASARRPSGVKIPAFAMAFETTFPVAVSPPRRYPRGQHAAKTIETGLGLFELGPQVQRRKVVASAAAVDYVWAHYVFLTNPPGLETARLDPLRDARLVHLRRGYAFDDPFVARAVMGERHGGASAADAVRFAQEVLPRLGAGGVACADAPAPPPTPTWANQRERRRAEREAPLTVCDFETAAWRWCWCRDAGVGEVWGPRLAEARRRLFGGF